MGGISGGLWACEVSQGKGGGLCCARVKKSKLRLGFEPGWDKGSKVICVHSNTHGHRERLRFLRRKEALI